MTIDPLSVWLHVGGRDPGEWARQIGALVPDLRIDTSVPPHDPAAVDVAVVWAPPRGIFAGMTALKAILCLSAGVDGILADLSLPPHVPVARLIPDAIRLSMRDYVLHAMLHHHRGMAGFAEAQRERRWAPAPASARRRVGVLGLGELGGFLAAALRDLGFAVSGWSRTPKSLPGVACHHGPDGLAAVARVSDILVGLLPGTAATVGLIDATVLGALPEGAYLINVGRGNHLVEADLLAALGSGHLSGATLDVLAREPAPPDHPFWTHPAIRLAPHIAAIPSVEAGAEAVAANIRRLLRGEDPFPLADRSRGY